MIRWLISFGSNFAFVWAADITPVVANVDGGGDCAVAAAKAADL